MVPMKLLQKSASYIAPDIAKMVNNSMIKGIFPGDLKFAEVSLLFKKKDALNKINYRPVSILIALSKIYEKAMSLQISEYFNNIFSSLLSAFRKGYSCGQRFWTWLKILSVRSTGVNILHVLAWISARPLIVYLTV